MTAGLLAKTALFPLHLWLPPAHAGAPAAASAVLSALVVKGSFFLIVRLWFDVMPGLPKRCRGADARRAGRGGDPVRQRDRAAAGAFEAADRLFDGRADRLSVPDVPARRRLRRDSPGGNGAPGPAACIQLVSHAFAKAAMFMAAGLIAEALGHDRIAGLGGVGRALPMTVFAFALGGMSLMGMPPSGGFIAKWLLLTAAVAEGQWWWAVVILAGGLLAARLRVPRSGPGDGRIRREARCRARSVPRAREAVRAGARALLAAAWICRCSRPACCRSAVPV